MSTLSATLVLPSSLWQFCLSSLPGMHHSWLAPFFLLSLLVLSLLLDLYLRHRRLVKINGCQKSYRRAPVSDPFIGFDFIYERLLRGSPPKTLNETHQDFRTLGSTYLISRWTTRTIHTCDARNIKHILASSFHDFRLPGVRVSVMSDLLGLGIFTLDGQAWSYTRALLRSSLTKAKMDSLSHILEHHVRSLLQHIRRDGTEVDLQPLFFKATMDVASEFLLGQSTDMLRNGGGRATEFVDSYMTCSAETVKKMRLGPLSFLRFNSSANQAREKVFEYMDGYIHTSLQSHQQKLQDGQTQRSLFLQDLAAAIGDGKTLRDQVLHIFLASRDTTASLLSNLFFVLAKNPAVYSKLRGEIMSMVGDSSLPTFEQLKRMTYLRWCVNECELLNAEL
jgi:cytochrome P450